jgi:hypothetical protein
MWLLLIFRIGVYRLGQDKAWQEVGEDQARREQNSLSFQRILAAAFSGVFCDGAELGQCCNDCRRP